MWEQTPTGMIHMKKCASTTLTASLAISFVLCLVPGVSHAQSYTLFGISGKQQADQVAPGVYTHKDHTLFEVNTNTALLTEKLRMTWVPDSDAIAYCSKNGLLYHTASSGAYRDNMTDTAHDQDPTVQTACASCQDNYYMENYDLLTGGLTGVYNANPCPNPDNPTNDIGGDGLYMPCFGLVAPIPPWALPQTRRDSTQTGPGTSGYRVDGPDEPSAGIRGFAWSSELDSWFVSGGTLYQMSLDGMTNTFVGTPVFQIPTDDLLTYPSGFQPIADLKALAFIKVGDQTKLFGTWRDDAGTVSGNTNGWIMEIDPATGANLSQIGVHAPPGGSPVGNGDEFGGLLGLAQNPQTGVVYGLRKTSDPYARELVTIDLTTGDSTLVGVLTDGTYGQAITTLAFVSDIVITAITQTGSTVTITWTGAAGPTFSLQTTASLTPPISWTTLASGLTGPSTSTSITNSQGFFKISKP
jgi:hypothetical protein